MKNALILAGLLVFTSLAVFGQGYGTQPADALILPVGLQEPCMKTWNLEPGVEPSPSLTSKIPRAGMT